MIVPFKYYGNLHPKKRKKLSKTRNVIENAFDLLRGRFRCLKYINSNIEHYHKIVVASCVLPNICLDFPSKMMMIKMVMLMRMIIFLIFDYYWMKYNLIFDMHLNILIKIMYNIYLTERWIWYIPVLFI